MRHFEKNNSPEIFQDFIRKNNPTSWDNMHSAQPQIYGSVCEELLKEQNDLCGYTELPLKEGHRHIDHYYKRSLFPEKCFCWDNFIMATMDSDFGARYKDKQINRREMYHGIFNPVVDNPQDYFEYNSLGEIKPKEDIPEAIANKANKTIEIFNLNATQLKNKRRDSVMAFYSLEDGGLPPERIIDFIKPKGFISLVNQLRRGDE